LCPRYEQRPDQRIILAEPSLFCEETICPSAGTGNHSAGFGRSAGFLRSHLLEVIVAEHLHEFGHGVLADLAVEEEALDAGAEELEPLGHLLDLALAMDLDVG
jgi:hypothetical protein